jgi:hypothetical protein
MEKYRGMEVQLHAFLTSALCGGKIDVQEASHLISIAMSWDVTPCNLLSRDY